MLSSSNEGLGRYFWDSVSESVSSPVYSPCRQRRWLSKLAKLGQGYSDCERVFNPAAVPGFTIVSSPSSSSASPLSPSSPSVFSTIKQEIVKDVKLVKEQVIGSVDKVENKVLTAEKQVVAAVKAEEKKWV